MATREVGLTGFEQLTERRGEIPGIFIIMVIALIFLDIIVCPGGFSRFFPAFFPAGRLGIALAAAQGRVQLHEELEEMSRVQAGRVSKARQAGSLGLVCGRARLGTG